MLLFNFKVKKNLNSFPFRYIPLLQLYTISFWYFANQSSAVGLVPLVVSETCFGTDL